MTIWTTFSRDGQAFVCAVPFPVTCEKHISDVEAIGHDHVEETMGYEHEGMSALIDAM